MHYFVNPVIENAQMQRDILRIIAEPRDLAVDLKVLFLFIMI